MNNLSKRKERINNLYSYYSFFEINTKYSNKEYNDKLYIEIMNNISFYEDRAKKALLKGIKWSSIPLILKSIIINGIAEILFIKKKKEIIISESNRICKELTNEDNHIKFVTAILNKID